MDIAPYNGLAYDEISKQSTITNRASKCALRIDISTKLQASGQFTTEWTVVAHELFHLFQNGMTNFKSSWMSEGTAKWAEYAVRLSPFYPLDSLYELPQSSCEIEYITENPNSVQNFKFWSRLIDLMLVEDDEIRVNDTLLVQQYKDGVDVFKSTHFRGMPLISALYQTLDAEDDVVSYVNNWPYHNWDELDKSSEHYGRVLNVIKRNVERHTVLGVELLGFLDAVDDFNDPLAPPCP